MQRCSSHLCPNVCNGICEYADSRRDKTAQARLWLPLHLEPAGGPSLDYLDALSHVIPVRAICQAQGDFPEGPWEPYAGHFTTPIGDGLQYNIVVSSDESVLARLYTRKLGNVAIVSRVRPGALYELRRWTVWTMREWSLVDHYMDTRWVPPDGHAIANALMSVGEGLGEREENFVKFPGERVQTL